MRQNTLNFHKWGCEVQENTVNIKRKIDEQELSALCNKLSSEDCTINRLSITQVNLDPDKLTRLINALKTNHSVHYLVMKNTHLGDKGAELIASLMENNQSIALLDLSLNQIGDLGASSLLTALNNHKTLRVLTLDGNKITHAKSEAFATLLRNHPQLYSLTLSNNDLRNCQAIISAWNDNSHLLKLSFFGNKHLNYTIFSDISATEQQRRRQLHDNIVALAQSQYGEQEQLCTLATLPKAIFYTLLQYCLEPGMHHTFISHLLRLIISQYNSRDTNTVKHDIDADLAHLCSINF